MSTENTSTLSQGSPFLDLPRELREIVYRYCISQYVCTLSVQVQKASSPSASQSSERSGGEGLRIWHGRDEINFSRSSIIEGDEENQSYCLALSPSTITNRSILLTCRQCYEEARPVFKHHAASISLHKIRRLGDYKRYDDEAPEEINHEPTQSDLSDLIDLAFYLPKLAQRIMHLTIGGNRSVTDAVHHGSSIFNGCRHCSNSQVRDQFVRKYLTNLQTVTWLMEVHLYDLKESPTATLGTTIVRRNFSRILGEWRTCLSGWGPSGLIKHVGGFVARSFPCRLNNRAISNESATQSTSPPPYVNSVSQLEGPQEAKCRHLLLLGIMVAESTSEITSVVVSRYAPSMPHFSFYARLHSANAQEDFRNSDCPCNLDEDITHYLQSTAWQWSENADPILQDMWAKAPRTESYSRIKRSNRKLTPWEKEEMLCRHYKRAKSLTR